MSAEVCPEYLNQLAYVIHVIKAVGKGTPGRTPATPGGARTGRAGSAIAERRAMIAPVQADGGRDFTRPRCRPPRSEAEAGR